MCEKKWDLSDLNGDSTELGLAPLRLLASVSTKMVKIYWCHRRDTNQSEPCLNPSCQNLRIRRFNTDQLYDLPGLKRGTALEAETIQWSCQQEHWCGVFPNNFRPLCERRHLQNVYNLQVVVFHSMSKVWQQHICQEMEFNCWYQSEILLAATTGRPIRHLWVWPQIHVQPRFQRRFRNDVTFLGCGHMCGLSGIRMVCYIFDW